MGFKTSELSFVGAPEIFPAHARLERDGQYYVSGNIPRDDRPHVSVYLHHDGLWRHSTRNDATGVFSGYFDTHERASQALATAKEELAAHAASEPALVVQLEAARREKQNMRG